MAHREIALPLRVRRIALRKAFSNRQPRLVGRQCSWNITLRHQHIAPARNSPGLLPWVPTRPGLVDHRLENSLGLAQISEADPGVPEIPTGLEIFRACLQRQLEIALRLAEIPPHQRQAGHIAGCIRFPAALAGR